MPPNQVRGEYRIYVIAFDNSYFARIRHSYHKNITMA